MQRRAVILSGSLGLGHDVISEVLTSSLERLGWECRTLDCMAMLGPFNAKVGDRVFRRLTSMPGLYDSLHFAHLRPGSRLARAMDASATKRLVPALRAELAAEPADLVISAFATGASAAAKLAQGSVAHRTMVICTDVCVYRFWVWEQIDLYLVTSQAAAASVRRYVPHARIAIVPPPVREAFYRAPTQTEARRALGVPEDARCVLLMGGGWGLGPLATTARALVEDGVCVLAVAGRNEKLLERLRTVAVGSPRLEVFGFTDRVPELMAAADVVVSTPGATTCSEARVVGRPLVLLDAVPGHGRENLQHELELGDAEAADASPASVTASVEAVLEKAARPQGGASRPAGEWDQAFAGALRTLGLAEPASGRLARRMAV
ncbi:MAG TPA: glycosyltransferase [Acidimicrobiales bacterium]|nr:glycosyltransferase [Acidimicrobiales bacterium]